MQGFCLLIFCALVFGMAVFQGASGYPVPRGCKYIAGNTPEIQWFPEAFCCCEYLSAPKLFKWSFSTLMFPGNGRFDLAYLTLSVSMSCVGGDIRQRDTEMEAVVCVLQLKRFFPKKKLPAKHSLMRMNSNNSLLQEVQQSCICIPMP